MPLSSALPSAFFVTFLFVLTGCRDQPVASYRVKKEEVATPRAAAPAAQPAPSAPASQPSTAPASAPDMASTAVPTAKGDGLTWTAPSHWTVKPASAMRRGSFSIKGSDGAVGDLAITAFPGNVGGNLANVNRWRGQIQLPPIGEADLDKALVHLDANGLHLDVVDLQGPAGADTQRILGAIVPYGDATWFFKLSGPDALVASEKSAFMTFLQTIKTR